MKKFGTCLLLALVVLAAQAQTRRFSGRVVEKKTGAPVEYATVLIQGTEQWSVTDAQGRFSILNIPVAKSAVTFSSLGYVSLTQEIRFKNDMEEMQFLLEERPGESGVENGV